MKKSHILRGGAVVAGTLMLATVASGVAFAGEVDGDGVDVTVDIPYTWEPGVLALTIAADSTTLTESGSTALERQFVGELPKVTVTDTRAAGEQWAVTGVVSDFTETSDPSKVISGEHLGWSPTLSDDPGDGTVEAGGDVEGELDGGPGLTAGTDLLYAAWDSQAALETRQGTWSAEADLTLKVGTDVAPGSYKALITLSLFD